MDFKPSRYLAYAIDARTQLQLTACGIRAPQQPFVQQRRKMDDFIAFIVIKGDIKLTDEMPDGAEHSTVTTGEIHVVAPDLWQTSTRPFASLVRQRRPYRDAKSLISTRTCAGMGYFENSCRAALISAAARPAAQAFQIESGVTRYVWTCSGAFTSSANRTSWRTLHRITFL